MSLPHSASTAPQRIDRPTRALQIGLGGVCFFLTLAVALRLRKLFLQLDSPITLSDDVGSWLLRLLIVGTLLTPLLHYGSHRLAGMLVPAQQRQGYGLTLLAPLALSLLALPLLAVRAVSPDAVVLLAVNTALLVGDVGLFLALRRYPATARVVPEKQRVLVYKE